LISGIVKRQEPVRVETFRAEASIGLAGFKIPLTARFRCQGRAMSQPRDDRQDHLFRLSLEQIIAFG